MNTIKLEKKIRQHKVKAMLLTIEANRLEDADYWELAPTVRAKAAHHEETADELRELKEEVLGWN